jgi:DNA-directed RNA polymerase subunit K/omega
MDELNDIVPQETGSQIPSEPAPPITSRFLYVDIAALRAKQLRRGARPRLADDVPVVWHKPERVAMEEVRRGLVSYEVIESKTGHVDGSA